MVETVPDGSRSGKDTPREDTAPLDGSAVTALDGEGIDTQHVRELAREKLFGTSGEPARIGRYVIIRRVGAGGMGVVFAAYDPELDRKIALKLVRGSTSPRTQARLLREARAMAKLSHPNVVQVYDAGTHEDRVYVAMEFVAGGTLGDFVRALPADDRVARALPVFIAAGRGLATAHDAGLIHRDFKPDNVLLDEQQVPRVTDFGLVRLDRNESQDEPDAPPSDPASSGDPFVSMTQRGMALGTPAYMSPEQFDGEGVDARTDQFSFCVSLYEAVYGERPFRGRTASQIRLAIEATGVEPEPKDATVAAWLRDILLRGLSFDRELRYPSMHELLAALARDPTRRRRRIALWGSAVTVVAGTVVGGALFSGALSGPCRAAARGLRDVWDDAARRRVDASLRDTGVPFADRTARDVGAAIDAWASRWKAARTDACEATQVRGEQSAALMDLRMHCLDRARADLEALVAILEAADRDVAVNAVEAVGGLHPLQPCSDADALTSRVPPPTPDVAREVEAIETQLAKVSAMQNAGQIVEALGLASTLEARALATEHPPTAAEVLVAIGDLESAAAQDGAAEHLLAAYEHAAGAGDEALRVRIALELSEVTALDLGEPEGGLVWARVGHAAARVLDPGGALEAQALMRLASAKLEGQDDEGAEAFARSSLQIREGRASEDPMGLISGLEMLAAVTNRQGNFAEALALHERALEVRKELYSPDHPEVATSLSNMGATLASLGRLDEADARMKEAIELLDAAHGGDHPTKGRALMNRGGLAYERGQYADALALWREAQRIFEKHYGAEDPRTAEADLNIGMGLIELGRYDEAMPISQHVLAIYEATRGTKHRDTARALMQVAILHKRRGEIEEAIALNRRALAAFEEALGPDHPRVASLLDNTGQLLDDPIEAERMHRRALEIRLRNDNAHPFIGITHLNLATALSKQKRWEEADEAFAEALRRFREGLPADHPHIGHVLMGMGSSRLERGDAKGAVAAFEEALALRERARARPEETAIARFRLAEAQWETGRRAHARADAQQAHDEIARAGDPDGTLPTISAWLDAH